MSRISSRVSLMAMLAFCLLASSYATPFQDDDFAEESALANGNPPEVSASRNNLFDQPLPVLARSARSAGQRPISKSQYIHQLIRHAQAELDNLRVIAYRNVGDTEQQTEASPVVRPNTLALGPASNEPQDGTPTNNCKGSGCCGESPKDFPKFQGRPISIGPRHICGDKPAHSPIAKR